jgi:pSer/pThr/pTyr-binding forkhead associated (FHA) protein
VQDNGRYFVEDNGTPGGTYLNDQLVNGRTPLQSGDRIRIGKSVLRFHERQKRK